LSLPKKRKNEYIFLKTVVFEVISFLLTERRLVKRRPLNLDSLLFAPSFCLFLAYLIKHVLRKGKKMKQKMHQKSNYPNSENVSKFFGEKP